MKYTHDNMEDFGKCCAFEGGRYSVLFGRDEQMLAALAVGAQGFVGSTYNYTPIVPVYSSIIRSFSDGNLLEARKEQMRIWNFMVIIGGHCKLF